MARFVDSQSRRGTILVLSAFMMVMMLALVAFAIDLGSIVLARTQLQAAADAAALAGAGGLADGPTAARTAASSFAAMNTAGGRSVALLDTQDVELGDWTDSTRSFALLTGKAESKADAVRVTCRLNQSRGSGLTLFFARVFGMSTVDMTAQAIGNTSSVGCGPFIGLNSVTISGGSYTDSYNSLNGMYGVAVAGDNGHVCSNQQISLTGSSNVQGNAHPGPTSTVKMTGSSYVVLSTDPLKKAMSKPPVDPGNAATVNNNGSIPLSLNGRKALSSKGDFSLSGGDRVDLPPGTYYFNKFTLSGGSSIQTSGLTLIYCTGDFTASGGSVVNSSLLPSNLQIYPMGKSCTLSGSSQFYGVIYGPTTAFTRSGGSSDFFGMIVAASLTLSGGGGLHYDEALDQLFGTHGQLRLVQ